VTSRSESRMSGMSGMCSFAADCQASLVHMSAVSTHKVCAIGLNPDIPDMASGHGPGESAPAIPRPNSRLLSGHTPPQPRTPRASRARSAACARTAPAPYYCAPLGSTAPHADARRARLYHRVRDPQRDRVILNTVIVPQCPTHKSTVGARDYGVVTAPPSHLNAMPEAQGCTAARKPRTARCYSALAARPSPMGPSCDRQSGTEGLRPLGLESIAQARGRSAKNQNRKDAVARLSGEGAAA
jgi:hypothetical protein